MFFFHKVKAVRLLHPFFPIWDWRKCVSLNILRFAQLSCPITLTTMKTKCAALTRPVLHQQGKLGLTLKTILKETIPPLT